MRRSLTVTPENDKKILLTKGRFLTGDAPFDIDYTTLVNIFIELGHKLMTSAWTDSANPNVVIDKNEIVESFKKHFFNAELKEESVGDQVAEIILENSSNNLDLLRATKPDKTKPPNYLMNNQDSKTQKSKNTSLRVKQRGDKKWLTTRSLSQNFEELLESEKKRSEDYPKG